MLGGGMIGKLRRVEMMMQKTRKSISRKKITDINCKG